MKEKKNENSHSHKKSHQSKTKHKVTKKPSAKKSYTQYVIGGLILLLIVAVLIKAFYVGPSPNNSNGEYGTTEVVFHIMSQCPFGTQVEDAIYPVLQEFGDSVDFRLEFIGSESPNGFNSLHGQPEVEGNLIQLCVQEKYPDELMQFVTCQNKNNVRDLKSSVDKCADEANIDASEITKCADGIEGATLFSASIKKSQAANAGGSPTMFFDGNLYSGARDANSFKKEICKYLDGHPECVGLPACSADQECNSEPGKIGTCLNPGKENAECKYSEDVAVELTIITSKDCTSCDTSQLMSVLSQVFLNMEVKEVEASSSEGKNMIKYFGIGKAPAYVFDGDLENSYAWSMNGQLKSAFKKVGDQYVIKDEASGSKYILDPVERKRMEELVGVKKGDNRPQIDFYVMSYCPYGNIAEEAIEPAFQLLKDSADFNPHYVIYSNYQGGGPNFCIDDENKYCSMHGVQEMTQGLRELCVDKYMGPSAYFEFVLEMNKKCSYKNADACWEPVAEELGLDTTKIKDCETNEWESILSKELALNQALGVQGSPTVFVEGQSYAGPRAAAGYAKSLCEGFTSAPDECSPEKLGTLGSAAPTPAADAGGCG